jgi:type II secretion system protein H
MSINPHNQNAQYAKSVSVRASMQKGFTLIEMMVVVIILSILSSAALLNMNFDNQAKQLEEHAFRLAALIELASDEAIYLQKELGLRFDPEGFGFYELQKNVQQAEKKTSQSDKPFWQAISEDKRLRHRKLPDYIDVDLEISGVEVLIEEPSEQAIKDHKVKPQLMMLSNGEIVPDFSITYTSADGEHQHNIYSGKDVAVVVELRP